MVMSVTWNKEDVFLKRKFEILKAWFADVRIDGTNWVHESTQPTPPCPNQCWLETENDNNQNFLERLSWRALLLNLVAGDLPAGPPLPPRGDMLGDKEALINSKCTWCLKININTF